MAQDLEGEETLLLHTETGLPLTVNHVRSTWKRYLCSIDPELAQVTPMVLRASFGTYMIHQYRTGAHFRGLNEQEFFDRLAAMMNTSSDMLANVYGACDLDDYRSTANEMMRIYGHHPREHDGDERVDSDDLNPEIEMVHGRTLANESRHRTNNSRPMSRVASYARSDSPDLNPEMIEMMQGRTLSNEPRHFTNNSRPMIRVASYARSGRRNMGIRHPGLANSMAFEDHDGNLDLA